MNAKSNRFDLEWWAIPKRLIYTTIALLAIGALSCGATLYVWAYGNPFKGMEVGESMPAGARFVSFDGDVRVVRANTRETITARGDTQLYPGDIVQTQADGRARISLADGSTLLVLPNSVVTIGDNTSGADGAQTNVRVAVGRGQISVRTQQQAEGANNVVETPQTENRLAAETGASFGVRDDRSEELRVTTGQIETATRSGEQTTIRAGEYVAVNPSGSVARRERLLDVPAPVTPRDLETIPVGAGGAASVILRWQRPPNGATAHYRVEVATSPFFVAAGKVIERDQLEATQFNAGDLRPGVYFWRVRAVTTSGQASEWSEPLKFTISAGSAGGPVHIADVAYEHVGGTVYLIRGRTQAGNTVRIAGRATLAASDGSFQLQANLPGDAREIVIEAEDPLGNRNRYRLALARDPAAQR